MASYTEEWLAIPSTRGVYQVEPGGRVRRAVKSRFHALPKGHLTPTKTGTGYLCVSIHVDGKCKRRYVHSLVAEVFMGPCPFGMQVNHIDGDKTNNCVTNLEYTTARGNLCHALNTGLRKPTRGERNGASKLTPESVRAIYAMKGTSRLQRDIAEEFGVSRRAVGMIWNGSTWSHVTGAKQDG